jgi:uncharacterized membrane protein YhaH (DUF805 family)
MREMSPTDWAVRPLRQFGTFTGRAPRAEYWWFALATSIVGALIALLDLKLGTPRFGSYGVLRLAWLLLLAIPTLAVTVRRLHDTNSSGYWALARVAGYLFLVPALSPRQLGAAYEGMSGWLIAVGIVSMIGWACVEISLFVLMVTPGTIGRNDYGPDPYGPDALEEVFA